LKTSIKTITYLSDTGCLEIQGASLNSSSNYDNSRNGNRRLIYSANGSRTFAGYYVIANNGTTNFFSTSGKRMFYTPKGGRGVYGGKDGSFCGALVVINGQFSLALTDNGLKIMYLSN
ncbi:hypothetical protein, partial [Shigella flexneri]|uniref:hypothetical protein n=1 Tax=Shigella flexneri TaxID=623 RepID=UPI003CE77559